MFFFLFGHVILENGGDMVERRLTVEAVVTAYLAAQLQISKQMPEGPAHARARRMAGGSLLSGSDAGSEVPRDMTS